MLQVPCPQCRFWFILCFVWLLLPRIYHDDWFYQGANSTFSRVGHTKCMSNISFDLGGTKDWHSS